MSKLYAGKDGDIGNTESVWLTVQWGADKLDL